MPKTKVEISTRKFYRTVLTLEILSEEEIPNKLDPSDIWRECISGGYSGDVKARLETIIDGRRAAKALQDQGSDPGFFRLTEKGEDADD